MQNRYIVLVNIFLLFFLLIFSVARSAKAKEDLLYKKKQLEDCIEALDKIDNV
jgi:hypothetical protein